MTDSEEDMPVVNNKRRATLEGLYLLLLFFLFM